MHGTNRLFYVLLVNLAAFFLRFQLVGHGYPGKQIHFAVYYCKDDQKKEKQCQDSLSSVEHVLITVCLSRLHCWRDAGELEHCPQLAVRMEQPKEPEKGAVSGSCCQDPRNTLIPLFSSKPASMSPPKKILFFSSLPVSISVLATEDLKRYSSFLLVSERSLQKRIWLY